MNSRTGQFEIAEDNFGVQVVYVRQVDGNQLVTYPVQGCRSSSREAFIAVAAFIEGVRW